MSVSSPEYSCGAVVDSWLRQSQGRGFEPQWLFLQHLVHSRASSRLCPTTVQEPYLCIIQHFKHVFCSNLREWHSGFSGIKKQPWTIWCPHCRTMPLTTLWNRLQRSEQACICFLLLPWTSLGTKPSLKHTVPSPFSKAYESNQENCWKSLWLGCIRLQAKHTLALPPPDCWRTWPLSIWLMAWQTTTWHPDQGIQNNGSSTRYHSVVQPLHRGRTQTGWCMPTVSKVRQWQWMCQCIVMVTWAVFHLSFVWQW